MTFMTSKTYLKLKGQNIEIFEVLRPSPWFVAREIMKIHTLRMPETSSKIDSVVQHTVCTFKHKTKGPQTFGSPINFSKNGFFDESICF